MPSWKSIANDEDVSDAVDETVAQSWKGKENIRTEIRRIPRDILERVVNNFDVRVAAVIQQRGVD